MQNIHSLNLAISVNMKSILYIGVLFLYSIGLAQPIVYKKYAPHLETPLGVVGSGTNQIIFNWKYSGNGSFRLTTIDSLGNIIKTNGYGTDLDIPKNIIKNTNNELMLDGLTFRFDTNGNYRSYVVITDTFGNFKREFTFKPPTFIFNNVVSSTYLNGAYYFIGEEFDSLVKPHFLSRPYIAKTDTFGNLIWWQNKFPESMMLYGYGCISLTNNKAELLIGASNQDTVINTRSITGYFLFNVDTNGNLIKRINLPLIDQDTFVSNLVTKIISKNDSTYLVLGNNNLFTLNNNFEILKNDTLVYKMVISGYLRGVTIYKSYLDDSYIIGGVRQMMKFFNGDSIFTRTFKYEPNFGAMDDVIPTLDGGYFAVVGVNNGTMYVKMDCMGNYESPTICEPLIEPPKKVNPLIGDVLYVGNSWQIKINDPLNKLYSYKIFNCVGQLISESKISTNMSVITIENQSLSDGIYFIKIVGDNFGTTLKAIK